MLLVGPSGELEFILVSGSKSAHSNPHEGRKRRTGVKRGTKEADLSNRCGTRQSIPSREKNISERKGGNLFPVLERGWVFRGRLYFPKKEQTFILDQGGIP